MQMPTSKSMRLLQCRRAAVEMRSRLFVDVCRCTFILPFFLPFFRPSSHADAQAQLVTFGEMCLICLLFHVDPLSCNALLSTAIDRCSSCLASSCVSVCSAAKVAVRAERRVSSPRSDGSHRLPSIGIPEAADLLEEVHWYVLPGVAARDHLRLQRLICSRDVDDDGGGQLHASACTRDA